MKRYIFALTLIFWSLSVFAEDSVDCTDSGSTYCQAQAAQDEFKLSDKELNDRYKEYLKALGSDVGRKKKFIDAQRAWIVYRDKLCDFENEGGSINSILWISCEARLTEQRLKEHKEYLNIND